MTDNKLLLDEARRAAQHREVKERITRDVDAAIEANAVTPRARETAEVREVATDLRSKAVREVAHSEGDVVRARKLARTGQFVDYAFAVVYGLLAIRLILALIAARPGAGFSQGIRWITDPLYGPFKGILPNLTTPEGYTLALPVLFALGMYAVLHLAVRGMLRLIGQRRTTL